MGRQLQDTEATEDAEDKARITWARVAGRLTGPPSANEGSLFRRSVLYHRAPWLNPFEEFTPKWREAWRASTGPTEYAYNFAHENICYANSELVDEVEATMESKYSSSLTDTLADILDGHATVLTESYATEETDRLTFEEMNRQELLTAELLRLTATPEVVDE